MPWNWRLFAVSGVDVYVVLAAMPSQIATLIGEMAYQRSTLQLAFTSTSVDLNAVTGSGGASAIMSW